MGIPMALFPVKPWWRRRRFWWPLAAAVILGTTFWLALARTDTSRIVIYNNTDGTLDDLVVTACGQSRTFRDVESGASVRFKLAPSGVESAISISVNNAAPWQGDYIEPKGGYRALIHINRNGDVECRTSLSAWF